MCSQNILWRLGLLCWFATFWQAIEDFSGREPGAIACSLHCFAVQSQAFGVGLLEHVEKNFFLLLRLVHALMGIKFFLSRVL